MEIDEKFNEWVLHLPQCLWELGAVNLPMTEVTFSHAALHNLLISVALTTHV